MPDVAFIADAPTELAAADGARSPASRSPSSARSGTASTATSRSPPSRSRAGRRNLAGHYKGELPIDLDHSTDRGGSTEAAGWIKGLALEGEKVYADVEWTSLGEAAIREKRYRYICRRTGRRRMSAACRSATR